MQAIFGVGFVVIVTSWVVGFLVDLVFAVLSYLFYLIGVVLFPAVLGQNPARAVIQSSALLILLFLVLGVLGFIAQWRVNQAWVLEAPEDR